MNEIVKTGLIILGFIVLLLKNQTIKM
ncbi:hypothetical protein CRENPOLYSF1_1180022 [Crenothrix polyspora]|uniref:Uncharacterized protein n=1 Tax=Crenothrix polyspora TaxID=360316 RepID=A0A1R4H0G9_9GAMM|nr:hypothetical protein CRENPOLYSF1_1180022 [Crenothrix polyspora]